jgi:hypothetical protein
MDTISEHIISNTTSTGITGPDLIFNNGQDSIVPPLSIQDSLLNDSRITPVGNGNPESKPYCTQPTGGQKWWAAVLLGFIFALISSPAAYSVTNKIATSTIGVSLIETTTTQGVPVFYLPNFIGLLIHTLIFIVIVRIILW